MLRFPNRFLGRRRSRDAVADDAALTDAASAPEPAGDRAAARFWHALWLVPLLLATALGVAHQRTGAERGTPPNVLMFTLSPASARPGEPVTLAWEVIGASSVRLDPTPGGGVPTQGQRTITTPDESTTFVLTAISGNFRQVSTVRLTVMRQPPAIMLFEAQPAIVAPGDGVILNWSVAGDDVSVTLQPGDGSILSTDGSVVQTPAISTVYTLVASNSVGQDTATVTVVVGTTRPPPPPQVVHFSVTPDRFERPAGDGATVTLSWSVTGADTIELTGSETIRGLAADDSLRAAAPWITTTYYLLASNAGGTTSAEVTVEVGVEETTRPTPAAPPIVVIPVRGEDQPVQIDKPRAERSGNTNDAAVGRAEENYDALVPEVHLFTITPSRARVGDEVVVRWAVSNAAAVTVQSIPAEPNATPLVGANAGTYRFIATQSQVILLEATGADGAAIRRQVGIIVAQPAAAAVRTNLTAQQSLLAVSEESRLTALVTDSGDVRLLREGVWETAGTIGTMPVSVTLAGTMLFVAGDDGWLRALDLSAESHRRLLSLDPWRHGAGASRVIELGDGCRQVVAVSAREGWGDDAILLVACADPAAVLALPVRGTTVDQPIWTRTLAAAPVALSLGTTRGAVAAVRYPLYSPRANLIDLLTVADGQLSTFCLRGAGVDGPPCPDGARVAAVQGPDGKVLDALPSLDGTIVVAAVIGDPALYVLDSRGVAPRRIALPAQVGTIAWSAGVVSPSQRGPIVTLPRRAAPEAPTASEAIAPPPSPPGPDPAAVAAFSTGAVLVTWQFLDDGALISLASWTTTPVVATFATRPLADLVDDGSAIVGVPLGPGPGFAFLWQEAPR